MRGEWLLQSKFTFQLILLMIVLTACSPKLYMEQGKAASDVSRDTSSELKENALADTVSPSSAPGDDKSSACLGCHAYNENHHPVDFTPADPSKFPFPLYNGQIRCLTCHTVDHMGSPFMLRGGPYADRREVCFKCHYEEEYRQIYPHIMLDGDGKFIEVNGRPVCLVCHSKTPAPGVDRTKDVMFRADVAFLCLRCRCP